MTTTVNVRVDEATKREVEALFSSLGINVSTAINMFFKQSLMEEALPFHPKVTRKTKHRTLRERVEAFYGTDFETAAKEHAYSFEELDWGEPVGEEVW